jgi:hypothetical protein
MSASLVCIHPGAIAGIVIGSVVFGALIMAAVNRLLAPKPVAVEAESKAHDDARTTQIVQSITALTDLFQSPAFKNAAHSPSALALSPGNGASPSSAVLAADDQPPVLSVQPARHDAIGGSVTDRSLQQQKPLRSRDASPSQIVIEPGIDASRLQHMLDDLGRLKQEMDQLAALSDAPSASRSNTLANSKHSSPPHRNQVTESPSPRTRAPAVSSSTAAVLPRSTAHLPERIGQVDAAPSSPPAPTSLSVSAARVLHLPEPDDIILPHTSSSAPAAAASPSKIARIVAPAIGSPSEVYVEISRLVAEAYRAVTPRLTQLPPLPAGAGSPRSPHVIPSNPSSLLAASPPRKSASGAAASPSKRHSPASPTSAPVSVGRRPTWRGLGGS